LAEISAFRRLAALILTTSLTRCRPLQTASYGRQWWLHQSNCNVSLSYVSSVFDF